MSSKSFRFRPWAVAVALGMTGLYLLTYYGQAVSADELMLLSGVESLTQYGALEIVSLYHERPVTEYQYFVIAPPWREAQHEPLYMLLGAWPYSLARAMPPLGLLQTAWLLNLWLTVGILVIGYFSARALNYSPPLSALAAVLTGVSTILWPYTTTFFREPLLAFLTGLAVLLAIHLHMRWRWSLAVGLVGVVALALFTKTVAVLLIPALLVWLLPSRMSGLSWRRGALVAGALVGLVMLAAVVMPALFPQLDRFNPQTYLLRIQRDFSLDYLRTVVGAYVFSPGRSLWATSPVLLLALPGAWLAWRAGRWQLALAPFVLLLSVALGYSLGGWDWHGGRGWGTRYLLHVVPVMALLILPTLQALSQRRSALWLPVGALIGFSVLVQLASVLVPLDHYYTSMNADYGADALRAYYDEGTWSVVDTMWYRQIGALDIAAPDVAWHHAREIAGPLSTLLLMALGGVSLARPGRMWRYLAPLVILLGCLLPLLRLDDDPRLLLDRPALEDLHQHLETHAGPEDIVLLADPAYMPYFLNTYRGEARWATLPYPIGERYSEAQTPRLVTDDPDARLQHEIRYVLDYAVQHYNTVWVIERQGAFHPWAYRPVEHYLARHFHRIAGWDFAADVRLIRFNTSPAPAYDAAYNTLYIPEQAPQHFGEHITLTGHAIPAEASAGEVLPFSLRWETYSDIPADYNISVQLLDDSGARVAGQDGVPGGGFAPTSAWGPDIPQADHHGLALPPTLPAGDYTLGVALYDWRDGARLPVPGTPDDLARVAIIRVR